MIRGEFHFIISVPKFGGLPKNLKGQNGYNSARFRTTLDFDREYLRNGSRYREAEKGVINYDPSHVEEKNCELWSSTKKVIDAHFGPPKINTVHAAQHNTIAFAT